MEEQHPTNGYHHHLPYALHPTAGYPISLSSCQWQNLTLTEPPSLPTAVFSSASGIRHPSLSSPINFSSSFPFISNNNLSVTSTTTYGLSTASNFTSKTHSSNQISSHSYAGINFSSRPVMSVTISQPSIIQPATHISTRALHLPATTLPSLANVLTPLTIVPAITCPVTTAANSLATVSSGVPGGLVVTTSFPVMSTSLPSTSVSVLASITYPLTNVTNTLTTSIPTLTDLTTIPTCLTTSSTPFVASHALSASITYPLTSITNTLTSSVGYTTSLACLTTTTAPPVTSHAHLSSTVSNQALFSSLLTTSNGRSESTAVTNSPHGMTSQPHLLSATTIQEDSLTKDVGNYSDTSGSTEDDGESPRSTTKEGTLAAVLALRDQYSPGSSSLSVTTAAQQPPMVSLDHLWTSRGSQPAVEVELKTEQADEIEDAKRTTTHHSNKPTPTTTTPTQSPKQPVVTTSITTPNAQVRSPSPTITADVTASTQSPDNTMGKYLQLLQQKQAEENSPPTTTHNTYKEEVQLSS